MSADLTEPYARGRLRTRRPGKGCVWWAGAARGEARERLEGMWVHQGCELEFDTESGGKPLEKRREVAA